MWGLSFVVTSAFTLLAPRLPTLSRRGVTIEHVTEGSDVLDIAVRFATGDLGEACPELLAPTFEFESASGRALLTKRRYLQAGYVSSLRAACPDLRVAVTDARMDDKGRALLTTRYSGTHTGAAWAPAEPLHCLGELAPVKAKAKALTA